MELLYFYSSYIVFVCDIFVIPVDWRPMGFHLMSIGTNATPPASKDGVFNCSEQLRLTVDSGALSRMARSSTVSRSCKEQLKIGLCWPVVWRLTFSGVGRMFTCRRLNILCNLYSVFIVLFMEAFTVVYSRINTKGKWPIQQRMSIYCRSVKEGKDSQCKMSIPLFVCQFFSCHILDTPPGTWGDVEWRPKQKNNKLWTYLTKLYQVSSWRKLYWMASRTHFQRFI